MIRLWAVVAVFAVITAARSFHLDIPLRDPDGIIFRKRLITAVVIMVVFALVEAVVRTGRRGWTPRRAFATLREKWTRERILLAGTGLLAYHFVYVCYRNLKSWDVFNAPQDGDLLRADKWLFFGHSPAVLLHDLLGQDIAAHILERVYTSFTNLVPLAFVGALVFTKRIRDGYMMLTAAIWVWILGVASYYLIPTLGPFASAPQEFAGLPDTSITATQAKYLAQRVYLLHHPEAGDAFASISAFASLHVAFTCMVFLMLRWYGLKRLSQVMGVYLVGVMVATVYFGWHFFVDDIAGVVLAYLAVLLARLTVYPRGRPAVDTSTAVL